MLRRSVIGSGLLHVAVIAATSVAWPMSFALPEEMPPAIPVDLVTVADVTNVAPAAPDPPKVEKPPDPPPQPEATPPPPPPPEAEVAPEPDKPPVPRPAPEKEQVAAEPTHPVRPRLKPPRNTPQKFDVDTVLALLDKSAPEKRPPTPAVKPAEIPVRGLGAQNASTVDIRDALLSQMRECWNVPVGAPDPEKLIVQVRVYLAQDGSLAQPPQLEPATRTAAASNPYVRTAAEAALRAVNVCEPYKHLPPDKYDVWREIVMTFDPSKMASR